MNGFKTHSSRYENQRALDALISEWTRQRGHYEVMHQLQAAGVAAGPIMDQRDAFADPHLQERGIFEEVYHEDVAARTFMWVRPTTCPICLSR